MPARLDVTFVHMADGVVPTGVAPPLPERGGPASDAGSPAAPPLPVVRLGFGVPADEAQPASVARATKVQRRPSLMFAASGTIAGPLVDSSRRGSGPRS